MLSMAPTAIPMENVFNESSPDMDKIKIMAGKINNTGDIINPS